MSDPVYEHEDYEDFEEFMDMSGAALRQVIMGFSVLAETYLDSLSAWELGQLRANLDRLSQIAGALEVAR